MSEELKQGDRIVVTKVQGSQGPFLHKRGIITRVDNRFADITFDDGEFINLFKWKLTLEEVYDSPLWKALR